MDDKSFEKLIKTAEKDITPREGLQERILERVLEDVREKSFFKLTALERFMFAKPLRTAVALSAIISLLLWTIMGSGYPAYLVNMVGSR